MKHNKHVIETNTLLGYVDQQVKNHPSIISGFSN